MANVINGTAGDDQINGLAGNDTLIANDGNDTLTGEAGQDSFRFDTTPGASNIDAISDFAVVDDTIQLENAVFTMFAAGTMTAGHPCSGAGIITAADADDHLILQHQHRGAVLRRGCQRRGAGKAVRYPHRRAGHHRERLPGCLRRAHGLGHQRHQPRILQAPRSATSRAIRRTLRVTPSAPGTSSSPAV